MRRADRTLFYLVLGLTFLGLVAVADVSSPQALASFNDRFYFVKQQGIWAAIGLVSFFVFSKIKYSFWEKVATPIFFVSVALLIAVLFPHFSYKALGARRWIDVGLFSFQPSELIKLSLVLYFAKLTKSGKKVMSFIIPLAVILGLIMWQPDLGTAIIICLVGFIQIFVTEIPWIYFLGSILSAGVIGAILVFTSSYRMDRLKTFLESTSDPLGKGYHVRQILLALGSGGIFGVGIGASRQKYLFLPEATTDSIFAIIAEELGLIGGIILLCLFVLFVFRSFKIAANAPDKFSQSVAVGITAWIGGQILLNIASMVVVTPLTGIPLPFFSYGGSSLVMILAACGILLNISSYSKLKTK